MIELIQDYYFWALVGFSLLMLGIRVVNFWLFAKRRSDAMRSGNAMPSQNIFIHMVSMMLMASMILYVMNPGSQLTTGLRTAGVAVLVMLYFVIYYIVKMILEKQYGSDIRG